MSGEFLLQIILVIAAVIGAFNTIVPFILKMPKRARIAWKNTKLFTLRDVYQDLAEHDQCIAENKEDLRQLNHRVDEIESLPPLRQYLGDGS